MAVEKWRQNVWSDRPRILFCLWLGLCQASSQVKQNSIKVEVGCLCEAGGRGSTEVEQLQHMLTLFMSALEYSINENC